MSEQRDWPETPLPEPSSDHAEIHQAEAAARAEMPAGDTSSEALGAAYDPPVGLPDDADASIELPVKENT
jgi:hypothetical protein